MKKTLNGYMTVEISMLFPIIFITLYMLFYICFYFHDRVVSQAFLYRFAIHTYFQDLSKEEMELKLRNNINEKMILFRLEKVKFNNTNSNNKIIAHFKISFPGVIRQNKKFDLEVIIENMNKSEQLRKYRFLEEVAK